jgi:SAM-dependent methyltransferase
VTAATPSTAAAQPAGTLAPGYTCRVCGGSGPFALHRAREMMFASGEGFDYAMCPDCGCLQIVDVPTDLARHYGEGYYSFNAGAEGDRGGIPGVLVRARNRHLSGRLDPLGAIAARLRPYAALASLRPLHLARDARVLDVGCGGGELLRALRSAGFERLTGADPFVARDLDLGGGARVLRRELAEVPGEFDLVMFHHSLEHLADPGAALRAAFARLAPGGACLVRIPTVSSWAWRHYGVDWCALDAPRHLMLHSRQSIARLAQACGFRLERIVDDSNGFQFWGSEQYRRGLPLMRPGCHDIVPAPGAFTRDELQGFERRARALNQAGEGDQIAVYLSRPAP